MQIVLFYQYRKRLGRPRSPLSGIGLEVFRCVFPLKLSRFRKLLAACSVRISLRLSRGKSKGPVFRKGHVVTEEDIPVLLSVGKEHLYAYEPTPGMVHENDAAYRIVKATGGSNLTYTEPKEGRINYIAACEGLLSIDVDLLTRVNSVGEMTLATLHNNERVHKGQAVAGTRVTPLSSTTPN
mgnify:CR=1 FL=1